ncbi:MAG TPA: tetratricopeptide repeat protein [Candidatus Acidoferrum sp.]|jgi:Tfp pilus assembly protein PilF
MRLRVRICLDVAALVALACLSASFSVRASAPIPHPGDAIESARQAYEVSDYPKAVQLLQEAATKDPENPEIFLLLAKSYNELQQHDQAIASAEKAVALAPQNSVYHEWLGRAYGEKAEHAGPFSGFSLAKKTRKEFETAVYLDEKNYSARQALIEYDCSAPGIVGGGEEKAVPQIARLAELDAAEGHYAAGNCRRQKKDFSTTDAEFTKSLDSHPKSANLIYDIGDYAMKHSQPDRLIVVADQGESAAPKDPRAKFYRAVALILKNDTGAQPETLLREYLKTAPVRNGYPHPHEVHEWLGRDYENQNKPQAAIAEYEAALKLDPKSRTASDALKRLKKS